MNHDNLIRLLKLTTDSKSPIIQELRIEVVNYVNSTEEYISRLETDNFQLFCILGKELSDSVKQESLLREMLVKSYKEQLN